MSAIAFRNRYVFLGESVADLVFSGRSASFLLQNTRIPERGFNIPFSLLCIRKTTVLAERNSCMGFQQTILGMRNNYQESTWPALEKRIVPTNCFSETIIGNQLTES